MAFTGKNPRFTSTILTDAVATTLTSPPSGAHKIIDRNGQLFMLDSTGAETPVGGGAGEKNYILAPSTTTGWTASGAGVTIANDTTLSELPRGLTTKTGIKITGVSGSTAYAYYRFTLDQVDYNRTLKVKFDLRPITGYVASDMKVDVYSNTLANYTGTSTRITTTSDASSIAAIPNMTGQYQTTVFMPGSTAPYMELRIGLNAASTQSIVVSDVVVGPGLQPQGAVAEPSTSWTPTFVGFGTVTSVAFQYSRVGEQIIGTGSWTTGTATASTASFTLPRSWLASETKIIGRWYRNEATAARKAGSIFSTAGSNLIQFGNDDTSTTASPVVAVNGNSYFSNTQAAYVQFSLVISDLIGSGTVNVVSNDTEYAFNTAGTTAAGGSDTTAFGYGPIGAAIGNIASTTVTGNSITSMRVRFNTPIQVTDQLILEVDVGSSGARWVAIGWSSIGSVFQGVANYGAKINLVSSNSTDVDVTFGNGGATTGPTYASAGGTSWANISTWRWRVRKVTGGAAIGFGQVAQNTGGLVKSAGQLLGTNTNDDAAVGSVGEYIESKTVATNIATTGTAQDITSITLSAGDWDISGSCAMTRNGATISASADFIFGISSSSGSGLTNFTPGITGITNDTFGLSTTFVQYCAASPTVRIKSDGTNYSINGATVSSSQVVYLKIRMDFSAGNPQILGILRARRVR